jgi:hypothetical protein
MRVVSGGKWTIDGRWVVISKWYGVESIVFDPDNGDPFWDIADCHEFIRTHAG